MFRPTRTTGGIAALALALTAVTILLDNPAAALAAGSLALFLLWRGWRFNRDLRVLATSLAVEREVDRTILRQGTAATVRVRVDLTVPPGVDVRVRDLPPAVAADEGALCEPGIPTAYTIRLMAAGETAFAGNIIEASDAFFSRDLLCRRFDAPHLQVFPVGTKYAGGKGVGTREVEVDRRATLAGSGVRGFRLYNIGDDPGSIDWKISARRGTLYVREPTGLEGGGPLIVVDLPRRNDSDRETFARFSMVICDAVEGGIESHESCSILVVTSGEVVRFLPRTEDLRKALQALEGLAPVEPRAPLYRAPGPAVLAARARLPGREGGQEGGYLAKLGSVLGAFADESISPFAVAVGKAMDQAEASEIRLYSLLRKDDASHLVQLTHEAKVRRMRVILRAPAGAGTIPGVDTVEVL